MRENAIRCDKPPVRALRKDDYAKSTLKRPICLSRVLAVSVLSLSGCMKWDTVSFSRVDEIFSSCYTSSIEHLFYTDNSLTAASRHADVIEKKQETQTLPQSGQSSDFLLLVEEDGFEPSKSSTTDLQSAPFGHSGTPPYEIVELVDGLEPPTC